MELSSTGNVALASSNPNTTVPRNAAISSDFDTFLKMLTAQISNQDPLNPINSEEFAVQLATFSGVEQQVRTNQLLESLAGQAGAPGLVEMASWVGMKARAAMPVQFSGDPITVAPPNPVAGQRHDVVALDSVGNEVWRASYLPSAGQIDWDGTSTAGRDVAPGVYSFQMESFEDGRLVATAPAQTYGRVQEVRLDRSGAVLVFEGGVERSAADVSALRQG